MAETYTGNTAPVFEWADMTLTEKLFQEKLEWHERQATMSFTRKMKVMDRMFESQGCPMTTTTESLVERAGLTDEDKNRVIAVLKADMNAVEPRTIEEGIRLGMAVAKRLAEAQLSKALWAVVDWLMEYGDTPECPTCLGGLIANKLYAANLERPE